MRSLAPRPVLLVLTLIAVVLAIAFIELRLDAVGSVSADDVRNPSPAKEQAKAGPTTDEKATDSVADQGRSGAAPRPSSEEDRGDRGRAGNEKPNQEISNARRVARKAEEYRRAEEISGPSGFVNADGFSVEAAAGEKVVLLEFWTYTCFNCQNVQPRMNAWHEEYAGDGLQVVGVHTPEFGFEKEYANVAQAVREAGIEYPVVLDNSYATWNAYDNRYWPAIYLIDADGFVRYKHFGEGAYEETEGKIEALLAERDRISG